MAYHHLDIEFDYDFELIGLSSHERDYRMCWALNRHMQWNLKRQDDLVIAQKDGESAHACYVYHQKSDLLRITLIDNKTGEGLLMPELAQFDFLLKVEDPASVLNEDFYKRLRKTPFLRMAFSLEVNKLKNKHHLISEE